MVIVRGRGGSQEELPHAGGQVRRPGGATPPPMSGGCVGARGPKGAIPRSRSERAVVRRYPSFKVFVLVICNEIPIIIHRGHLYS